jgi:cytoskeletal protein RodZ
MFVKPEAGRTVRDPVKGTLLPEEGAEVPESTFWNRRLRDGDVVKTDAAQQTKAASKVTDTTTDSDKTTATTNTGSAR